MNVHSTVEPTAPSEATLVKAAAAGKKNEGKFTVPTLAEGEKVIAATIHVYCKVNIESKSLKFYLASYRNERAFNEAVTNRILDDFVRACAPRYAIVTAQFSARGGIALTVRAEHAGRKRSSDRQRNRGSPDESSGSRGPHDTARSQRPGSPAAASPYLWAA